IAHQKLRPQIVDQLLLWEDRVLLDREVLGDLGKVLAVVRRHGEAESVGPALRHLAARAEQGIRQARPKNGSPLASLGLPDDGWPFLELLLETGIVPKRAATQAHVQHRDIPVQTLP